MPGLKSVKRRAGRIVVPTYSSGRCQGVEQTLDNPCFVPDKGSRQLTVCPLYIKKIISLILLKKLIK
jgi:hypothetical protein